MEITLRQLALKLKGEVSENSFADIQIENVLFDSRRLNSVKGTVFFAIKTQKNDGAKYIDDLYNKGVRLFVVDDCFPIKNSSACFLRCKDVVAALQTLAVMNRERYDIPILAITGSNGKTITKDWILSLIAGDKNVCANAKSYNSQIGVPYSVCSLNKENELGIFEAGISKKGEMFALEQIIKPTMGIFTNIGDAHQINFSSLEEKIDEKLLLFKHCKQLIFHNTNTLLTNRIKSFAEQNNIKLISWGEEKSDTYKTEEILREISPKLKDRASIENIINAYIFCRTMGISKTKLVKRIKQLHSIKSRMEILQGVNNSTLLNDAYSNDYTSLEIALDLLNTLNKKDKLLILSDIQQTSSDKQTLYSNINSLLQNKNINNLIAIGKDFLFYKDLITIENVKYYKDTNDFIQQSKRKDYLNKTILIKGASSFHFEQIVKHLSLLGHQSVMEINLSALEDNINFFRSCIKNNAMICAMVKADAYGAGAKEVALFLENNNLVNYLAVAFADEGVELRQYGVTLPIMVMTPEEYAKEKIIEYNLEPVVHSFEVLERFFNTHIDVHIKLDTGMHRLGFEEKDLSLLIKTLKEHPEIRVKSVFSHLYGADDENLDMHTSAQMDVFGSLSDRIIKAFDYKIIRHLCNSAAIPRFRDIHFDMVRLGIGMYGVGYDSSVQKYLRPVMHLYSTITQIREIAKGENVSYSNKFVSKRHMRIAVIPVGYADGLNRHLGNERFSVYVKGKLCRILGNICMDMCMIDVSDVEAGVGDRVEIFGENNPVQTIADVLETIPYEIFTSVSQRIKRIYYRE